MMEQPNLLVANLEGEIDFARDLTPGPHPHLSDAAARVVGPAASMMALLASRGDRLWLPAPAAPEQVCAAARERCLLIETAALHELAPAPRLCAWAETAAVARLRRPGPTEPPGSIAELAEGPDWRAALWHLWPTPEVAARVNHRGFALSIADSRGWSLPGARLVRDMAELDQHLASGAAEAGHENAWVLKAPLSAAGRERMRHRGDEIGRGERVRLERLFARFGQLLFEPWVDRAEDLACAGLVHPGGVRLFPPHRLDNDPRGVFRAAIIDDAGHSELALPSRPGTAPPGRDRAQDPAAQSPPGHAGAEVRAEVGRAAAAAGLALSEAGYRGPFSVDAYTWRDSTGAVHLQRMSEINARLSFGLLARIAAEDAGAPGGPFELRL